MVIPPDEAKLLGLALLAEKCKVWMMEVLWWCIHDSGVDGKESSTPFGCGLFLWLPKTSVPLTHPFALC